MTSFWNRCSWSLNFSAKKFQNIIRNSLLVKNSVEKIVNEIIMLPIIPNEGHLQCASREHLWKVGLILVLCIFLNWSLSFLHWNFLRNLKFTFGLVLVFLYNWASKKLISDQLFINVPTVRKSNALHLIDFLVLLLH